MLERLIKHLKIQIETAEKLDSQFVYITLNEARLALKLAEYKRNEDEKCTR